MTIGSRLHETGMSPEGVRAREHLLAQVLAALQEARAGEAHGSLTPAASDLVSRGPVTFFVPGRIEVLGKHTDYAGGRSLVCAVERGFVVAALPRPDRVVRVIDVAGGRVAQLALDARLPAPEPAWARYPATVVRRIARNFPAARVGADLAFVSDLPLASGMSSSSAFMVATFLPVAALNRLEEDAAYRRDIASREDLAGYLGTVENGQNFGQLTGDRGVGTFGGSEDHTAMLCARAGELSQYSFCPVRHERQVPFPRGHAFAVAYSGVVAEKTGAAMEAYNRASLAVRAILAAWNAAAGRRDPCLAAAVADGVEPVRGVLRRGPSDGFNSDALEARFEQFVEESLVLVPAAGDALAAGDVRRFGAIVDRSQHLAERLLGNQVPETIHLAASARRVGAAAASAFGAGFGGSVWALVRREEAEAFVSAWRAGYAARFPEAARGASFLVTRPGPHAAEL